jgi:hypothetical protein
MELVKTASFQQHKQLKKDLLVYLQMGTALFDEAMQ